MYTCDYSPLLLVAFALCSLWPVTFLFYCRPFLHFSFCYFSHIIATNLSVVIKGPDRSGRVPHGESLAASLGRDHSRKIAPMSITSAPCPDCVSGGLPLSPLPSKREQPSTDTPSLTSDSIRVQPLQDPGTQFWEAKWANAPSCKHRLQWPLSHWLYIIFKHLCA